MVPKQCDAGAKRATAEYELKFLVSPERRYLRSSGEVLRRLRIRQYADAPDDGVPARLTGLCFLE